MLSQKYKTPGIDLMIKKLTLHPITKFFSTISEGKSMLFNLTQESSEFSIKRLLEAPLLIC